ITPHAINFQKPVTIRFSYTDEAVKNTVPELLGIGYQQADGSWRAMGGVQVDKSGKTASVRTTHFSDWGFFPLVYLQPTDARVNTSEELDMTVMCATLEADRVPEVDGTIINAPFIMPETYIGKWDYSGAGTLDPTGAHAYYKAPAKVPAANPEAVSVQIKMHRPGTYLIVSNITILSKFHIDYLQVDETETGTAGSGYPSLLYIHGNFGNDPGTAVRSVKIGAVPLTVMFWTPNLIGCQLTADGPTSSGVVNVSNGSSTDNKLLNEWWVEMTYEKIESPDASLTKKATVYLRFRGDADGYFREGEQSKIPYTDLNVRSKVVIDMPQGSFSTHTTEEGCADHTVKWGALTSVEVPRVPNSQSNRNLSGYVYNRADGFRVQLHFMSDDILSTTRIMVPCGDNAVTNQVKDNISLAGYQGTDIYFKFSSTGKSASILAGEMPRLDKTGVASGLYFDFGALKPELFYTTLKWKEAVAKYR
ncbi:MAG TPA: hypothetical protein VI233_09275, partial [Puia sp.]